ncbi:alpha/beta fold hydrolase [Streptomyces sirii]|uniref:alpha/beta fold hydrolase n=1 Tax=Streptomyces sirii TaxID=3127701 RepID=UPI003D3665F9
MTPTNRPPVVLLHALPLDSSMWDTQARRLRARGHPVLTYDQRGFGGTPWARTRPRSTWWPTTSPAGWTGGE